MTIKTSLARPAHRETEEDESSSKVASSYHYHTEEDQRGSKCNLAQRSNSVRIEMSNWPHLLHQWSYIYELLQNHITKHLIGEGDKEIRIYGSELETEWMR